MNATENVIPRRSSDDGQERRSEVRQSVNQPASLKELLPYVAQRREVQVLEISKSGLKLHVSRQIDPGTLVQIRLEDMIVTGEVRYWVSAGDEFQVGIQIQDAFSRPL